MPTEQAERFIQWFTQWEREGATCTITAEARDKLIESCADTQEGRLKLAEQYVIPAQQQMQNVLKGSRLAARRVCLRLEGFLACFPPGERFSDPLIRIRESLIELYAYLSPRYERQPDGVVSTDYSRRVSEPYDGPRVSRYKRGRVI